MSKLDEILEKDFRYFNRMSPWNVDDRMPEAVKEAKHQIKSLMLQDCLHYVKSMNSVEATLAIIAKRIEDL